MGADCLRQDTVYMAADERVDVDRGMTETDLPVLYSFRRCPYAMRARLALASAGVKCALREIVLRDKAPEFVEASPKATVPVLVDAGGSVLEESLDIMDWALGRHDPEGLLPADKEREAAMRALIAKIDGPFKMHLDRYKYPNRFEGGEPIDIKAERAAAGRIIDELDTRLTASDWLFGDRPGYADLAILPFVRQFAFVDKAWFDAQPWPHVRKWLDRFLASDRFLSVMAKYPKWQAGDPVMLFPD